MEAKRKKPTKKKKNAVKLPVDSHIEEECYVDEKGLAIDDGIDHESPLILEDIEALKDHEEDEFEE